MSESQWSFFHCDMSKFLKNVYCTSFENICLAFQTAVNKSRLQTVLLCVFDQAAH